MHIYIYIYIIRCSRLLDAPRSALGIAAVPHFQYGERPHTCMSRKAWDRRRCIERIKDLQPASITSTARIRSESEILSNFATPSLNCIWKLRSPRVKIDQSMLKRPKPAMFRTPKPYHHAGFNTAFWNRNWVRNWKPDRVWNQRSEIWSETGALKYLKTAFDTCLEAAARWSDPNGIVTFEGN